MVFIPVFITLIAAAVTVLSVYYTVRTLRQQIKLYNSIQLVILKTRHIQYLIAGSAFFAAAILCFALLLGGDSVFEFCAGAYSLSAPLVTLILIMLILMLLALGALNGVMFFSRSAIVDRGIQTPNRFVSWHRLYYYLVDEEKNKLLFSVNKKGPYTLMETFGAFSFNINDIEKIKFILNKNKNKFLKHYDVR